MAATLEAEAPVAAPPAPPPERPWWDRLDLWVGLLVVAACCAFVFVQLDPQLLFRNTTPSGGDTAAHVWWPAYLRDHLLPWRLAGWSPDFYNGFAAGQYYFPVPALLIVITDVILPYNIAFKLVTALGPILLPIAAYVFGRGIRAPAPAPAAFAVGATAFLFFTGDPGSSPMSQSIAFNQHIMGGTLASNLAGEFSFTLALAFALFFLGTLATALRTGRRQWLPAVLLALTVMSHLVVAIFAVVGALVVWLASRPVRSFPRAAIIGTVGTLLTAVWVVPLAATLQYTTDMRYEPVGYCPAEPASCEGVATFGSYLFPSYLFEPQSAWPWEWGAYALIAFAVIGAVVTRRRSTILLVTLTALAGLLFRFWEDVQATPAWNLRFVPFWYLGIFLLMAAGLAEVVRGAAWLARRFVVSERRTTPLALVSGAVIGSLTILLSLGALVGLNEDKAFLPYWIRWNYRGYEDEAGTGLTPGKSYSEYRTFIDTVGALPPGRLTWEGNSQLNAYGSPLALMLLPYWTDGRISSMEGVYYEASASTPYHFMTVAALVAPGNASNAVRGIPYRDSTQFSLGVRWLQTLGVRYLALHSTQARQAADADERLRLVATSPDLDAKPPEAWSIYRVADSELVAPLQYEPVVVEMSDRARTACEEQVRKRLDPTGEKDVRVEVHEWQDCIAVPWFDDPETLDRPLVAEGPASWRRAGPAAARSADKEPLPEVRVTRIRADDDSVSFRVSRTGVPVYVKTSWYPNWEAEGADGPYRATPNLMVVVPTERDVTLHYGTTTAEWLGRAGTLAGVAGVVGLVVWPRRRRRTQEIEARPVG